MILKKKSWSIQADEFITFYRIYGRTVNPYHPGRICGGSSGGEGSIIASGASIFGIGSDVGGR